MQLPVDWKIKTLGEIAEVQSGGTPLKSRNETFTKAPKELITPKGLEESNTKIFPKGSLLIGMYDTAALKMSILDRDAAFNQAIAGVKPNEKIDLKFILYAVNSRKLEILNQRRGVRQKNLSLAKIKNIALPVPPLPEQKRIVAILDEGFEGIDRAIANTENNLTNSRELFESYLNAIFTQKGDGWEWVSLSEITTDITERFIDENLSRNEQLANLMRLFGICEEKGSGIDKVVSAAEVFQLPAPDFRVGEIRTTAILFAHQNFADMRKSDRIRACYQHCCLLYINNRRMSNQTLRERFGLSESGAATVSLVIKATKEDGFIKMDESESTSTRYASYLPFWA